MERDAIIIRVFICLLFLLLLSGCASVIPREMKQELSLNISIIEVKLTPESYKGTKVLWGGYIANTINKVDKTIIQIVHAPLGSLDRPGNIDHSKGRFIIEYEGFLDSAIYSEGREITLAGEIIGSRKGLIGEMDYTFPLLKSIKIHLWEVQKEEHEYRPSPFFCDPFYYPYCRPYYPYYYPPERKK